LLPPRQSRGNSHWGLDPQARLAVLLATTGLTQLDLAKLLGVASRTVRR
jgi:DNA-binding XRE family transcriptional regulator